MLRLFFVIQIFVVSGCVSTAPSNYELNRRSGLDVAIDQKDKESSDEETAKEDLKKLRTGTALGKSAKMPARLPAIVERVWVYDQLINDDQWLQGTWVFIEVEGERWLPQVDSGHGVFIQTGEVKIKKEVTGE